MRVRMVSYNIMQGGEGRADPIAETLLGRKPDIVGIHEANDASVLRRLSDRLRMEFVVAQCDGGVVALFSRYRIATSVNISLIHNSSMPILDAQVLIDSRPLAVRVAHLTTEREADRMANVLQNDMPEAMLMSHEPPRGMRTVDGKIVLSNRPPPSQTIAPIRQIDQVLVQKHLPLLETWIEQDRLAYYASDHLPSGVEIELR